MRRNLKTAIQYALILNVLAVTHVNAEPVVVTAGSVTMWWDGRLGNITLLGPGLQIVDEGYGVSGPLNLTAGADRVIAPGVQFDPAPRLVTATVNGVTYEAVDLRGVMFFVTFPFDVPTAPLNSIVTFTAPFFVDGGFSVFDAFGAPLFGSLSVTGGGIMTTELRYIGDGRYVKDFGATVFEFNDSPVPEPATVLLVCSGLAALGVRRHRLRARGVKGERG